MNSFTFAQILLSVAAGAFAGGLVLFIGVWGVEKKQNRRLYELETDVESLRESSKSFQKTVSGRMGQQKLKDDRTIEQMAKDRLRQHQAGNGGVSDDEWLARGGK